MATSTKMDANDLAQLLGAWSSGHGPLYRQLVDSIESLIDQGALRNGVRLPAERKLAVSLSVSRSTTVSAYEELQSRGRVVRRQGSGTEVVAASSPGHERDPLRSTPLFDLSPETRVLLQALPACNIDLATEYRAMAESEAILATDIPTDGWWELRTSIAARYSAEGLPTDPSEILITSGTQQGCNLLVMELCQPGDVVLCEALTWPGLTDAVERVGGRCHGIAMDEHGLDVEAMRAAVERLRPVAIVVNPHHHNPTGTRLLPHRRQGLADIAADYGVPVVEDRVFAPLAYDRDVPPPLASLRSDAPLVTVDSLSKSVWAGLRIGWIRATTDLIGRLRFVKAIDDLGTSVPSQILANQLLPRLDELLEQRCAELAGQAARAHTLCSQLLSDWTLPMPKGGASLWAELPQPVVPSFIRHAARYGVLLVGDEAFAVAEPTNRHIRLPFTGDDDDFADAIYRVASAWSTFEPQSPGRHPTPTLV